jgi:preprotein translocase subunit SecG
MIAVLVVVHLLIAIALIVLILLQKTEGAAGGGFSLTSAVNSMNQPRARANPIGRATSVLGFCFFATSLGLALLAQPRQVSTSVFETPVEGPAVPKVNDIAPAVPAEGTAPDAAPAVPGESSPPPVPSVPNN